MLSGQLPYLLLPVLCIPYMKFTLSFYHLLRILLDVRSVFMITFLHTFERQSNCRSHFLVLHSVFAPWIATYVLACIVGVNFHLNAQDGRR